MTAQAWFRAAQPWRKPTDRDHAARAAKLGGAVLLLQAALSAWSAVDMSRKQEALTAAMRESMASQPGATPEMTETVFAVTAPLMLALSAILAVVFLVFGAVQWRRQTHLIPLIFVLFVTLGLAQTLQLLITQPGLFARAQVAPVWQLALGHGTTFICLIVAVAAWRGGLWLRRNPQ